MIDSRRLLAELQKLLKALEKDIRERLDEQPALDGELKAGMMLSASGSLAAIADDAAFHDDSLRPRRSLVASIQRWEGE